LVGTDYGQILRKGRFVENIKPYNIVKRKDGYSSHIDHITSRVTCLDFSIFLPEYFLAGFDCGMFGLYLRGYEDPVMMFRSNPNSAIVDIKWSACNPSIFFVFSSDDQLMVFDLAQSEKLVSSEVVSLKSQQKDRLNRVSCKLGVLSLSQKGKAQQILEGKLDALKSFSKSDRLAIGYSDGRVDLHWVETNQETDLKATIDLVGSQLRTYVC